MLSMVSAFDNRKKAVYLGALWLITYHAVTFGLINYCILSLAAKKEEREQDDTENIV